VINVPWESAHILIENPGCSMMVAEQNSCQEQRQIERLNPAATKRNIYLYR